jgi:hypothetical protein
MSELTPSEPGSSAALRAQEISIGSLHGLCICLSSGQNVDPRRLKQALEWAIRQIESQERALKKIKEAADDWHRYHGR